MWLHCNNCGIQKSENITSVRYSVGLLCSHVLCEKCNLSKICPIDKRSYQGIEINNSKMRMFFEDPNKLLKSWQKCVRFQCEQRNLCEARDWPSNNDDIRKIKEQISVLDKFEGVTNESIEKHTKCINKMKAYLIHLAKRRSLKENIEIYSINTTLTSSTSSALSLNVSNNALAESGVDMDFDNLNRSN